MEETVFSKIIRREIPADIVYEDETTLAFLDIAPVNKGHTLVIPKKRMQNIFDADDETLAALMRTVRKISPVIVQAVGAHGLNIHSNHGASAGQIVFHLHMHLIPRFENDHLATWPHTPYKEGEAKEIAHTIRSAISG